MTQEACSYMRFKVTLLTHNQPPVVPEAYLPGIDASVFFDILEKLKRGSLHFSYGQFPHLYISNTFLTPLRSVRKPPLTHS